MLVVPEKLLVERNLDTQDTAILKGLAITAIVFHNFFHFVSPARQNEFTFDPARFMVFLDTVKHPSLAIQAFFSFFGHLGVQVFIFLSAYGLSRSHWDDPTSWIGFMGGRIRKLYPQFALVVVPWFVVSAIHSMSLAVSGWFGLDLAFLFFGLPSVLGYGIPPVGPWWFIPFIVELYAVWPLLRTITNRFGWYGLLVLAVLCLAVGHAVDPLMTRWSTNLMFTPIGRMSVICFGVAAARYPIRINAPLALAGLAVLLLGSRYGVLWPLSFIGALIVALWMYMQVRGALRKIPFLVRLGDYSLLVFLLNAIVRDQFLPYATSPALQLLFGVATAVVSFGVAACMYEFFISRRRPAKALAA